MNTATVHRVELKNWITSHKVNVHVSVLQYVFIIMATSQCSPNSIIPHLVT